MRGWMKWGAGGVVVLVVAVGALIATGLFMGERRAARRIDIVA